LDELLHDARAGNGGGEPARDPVSGGVVDDEEVGAGRGLRDGGGGADGLLGGAEVDDDGRDALRGGTARRAGHSIEYRSPIARAFERTRLLGRGNLRRLPLSFHGSRSEPLEVRALLRLRRHQPDPNGVSHQPGDLVDAEAVHQLRAVRLDRLDPTPRRPAICFVE
jgi:hypothetical protein